MRGHSAQLAEFAEAAGSGQLHHGWLFAGPRGIGKAMMAEAAARMILPGSQSAALLDAGSHPDCVRLERLINDKGVPARSITVDQVRGLRNRLTMSTAFGGARVVIIDSVDELEGRGSPNALLKSLEEPPAGTIFLLISHAPGRLLPTIRSRCRLLNFRALGDHDMAAILTAHGIDAARQPKLIEAARGIPAEALAMAALDLDAIDAALAAIADDGDPTNARRSALASSMALKAALPRYEAFLHRAPRFIADRARHAQGDRLERVLDAWAAADMLGRIALPQSLVAETVVFEMAGHVATLAPTQGGAKA